MTLHVPWRPEQPSRIHCLSVTLLHLLELRPEFSLSLLPLMSMSNRSWPFRGDKDTDLSAKEECLLLGAQQRAR